MDYEIIGGEAFPLLKVNLGAHESIKAESRAMVSMSTSLSLKGTLDGGIGKAIARKFVGESAFMQEISADGDAGWAMLASFLPGSIMALPMKGEVICVQKGSFLAASQDIDVGAKVQSISKGLFGGEGLFVVKVSGAGDLFLSSYGGIYPVDIKAGEEILVDNGHLVAWDAGLEYEITKGGSTWFSSMTSGEFIALRFKGPGRIWLQSRNLKDFKNWLVSLMPVRRSN